MVRWPTDFPCRRVAELADDRGSSLFADGDRECFAQVVVFGFQLAVYIDTEAERASIGNIGLESWVEGEPEHFIRLVPVSIAGQRLRPA